MPPRKVQSKKKTVVATGSFKKKVVVGSSKKKTKVVGSSKKKTKQVVGSSKKKQVVQVVGSSKKKQVVQARVLRSRSTATHPSVQDFEAAIAKRKHMTSAEINAEIDAGSKRTKARKAAEIKLFDMLRNASNASPADKQALSDYVNQQVKEHDIRPRRFDV